jgi:hypothetical protein
MHNHSIQRMRASRLRQSQSGRQWRLARTADAGRSATLSGSTEARA